MFYKSICIAVTAFIVMTPSLYANDSITDEKLSLQDALDIALANNQGLARVRSQADAVLTTQSIQHNANFLLRTVLLPRLALDVTNDPF